MTVQSLEHHDVTERQKAASAAAHLYWSSRRRPPHGLYKELPLSIGDYSPPPSGSLQMVATLTLLPFFVSFLELCAYSWAEPLEKHNSSDLLCTCNQIAAAISGASQVFFPRESVILSLGMLKSDE